MRSLENPFDTMNGQPKYPDGKAGYSIGRRHQHSSEVTLDDYMIVLFPGSINWCLVLKPTPGYADPNEHFNQIWANHSTNISFNYAFSIKGGGTYADPGAVPAMPDNSTTARNSVQWEVGVDGFVKWRPVAYAMHTQLLNTTDRNEGWYEAVRVDKNSLIKRWGVLGGTGSPLGNGNYVHGTPHFHMGGCVPSYDLARLMYTTKDWSKEPTYITGELQDIHNAVFQLNAVKHENDFVPLKAIIQPQLGYSREEICQRDPKVDETSTVDLDMVSNYVPKNKIERDVYLNMRMEDVPKNDLTEMLVSDAFDCIIVRIHGTAGTKLLIHSVANMEFLSAENGQMAQYATASDNNNYELKQHNWNRNTKYKYPFHYLASGGYLRVPRPPYY